ncbi:type II toxin-antitoxin system Phd/YefM family antitoxin [Lactobacillus sp. ESL0791]|uniref:type II toxin-antitoxin system Phd/YefM family antitoxin n=1 Tax=Lactobacillus sp. ESL0791 TaxID=2983234 RepID=UPI0023F8D5E6|nr:type II toxin-antitoxin system Phd/YefM family antitoxin [Lactobacillus sp. ESL0791]MDF7639133.1 type II toxin-antitoxin system Phd/YefM family antitoxin [Lactobacillus sp. ESL0791]
MEAVAFTEFRKNLKSYMTDVNDNSSTILITSHNSTKNSAVLLSKTDYDNMIENLKIMSDSNLMEKIKQGNAQIDAGKAKYYELIDN